ncbi:MAG: hypothetical protein B7Y82_04720 [Sphingomonadales bacterium 32-65-25]|nr:MAG: hypothetical protein B7Y82_04720 [Sphingomonadales bacterium 32-65-25]
MADAHDLALRLGGRWHGSYGTAPCPVCQPDRRRDQDALTLADGSGGLLLHCKRLGCGFRDVLAAAGICPGSYRTPDPAIMAKREAERRAELAKRESQARALWKQSQPIGGTLAETYLRHRGITCPLPATLRFHRACWHGASFQRLPAMVGLVEGGDGWAVHRTYLRDDGTGKAAVEPAKAMLGATAGGAVRLSGGPGRLVVAEGIETALALLCGLSDGPAMVWAGLSTSGLRGLHLPAQPGRLTIACDGDAAGRAAALALAERAHALRWTVATIDPGDGADFNDILNRKDAA